eukprot:289483-Rhodomonas_salina.1
MRKGELRAASAEIDPAGYLTRGIVEAVEEEQEGMVPPVKGRSEVAASQPEVKIGTRVMLVEDEESGGVVRFEEGAERGARVRIEEDEGSRGRVRLGEDEERGR